MGLSTMWYFITVRTTACVVATHYKLLASTLWSYGTPWLILSKTEYMNYIWGTTLHIKVRFDRITWTVWVNTQNDAPNLVRRYHGHTEMTTLSKKICSIPAFGTGILWSVFKLNWIIYGGVMGEKRFWYFLVLDLHLWPWARCSGVTEGPPMNMWSKLDHFQQSCGQISKQWHGALGHMHHTIPYHTIPYHPGRCGLDLLRTSSAGMGRKEG